MSRALSARRLLVFFAASAVAVATWSRPWGRAAGSQVTALGRDAVAPIHVALGLAEQGPDWWDIDFECRDQVVVRAGTATLPAGYSVSLQLDHKALVDASLSLATGDDVRVVYWDGVENTELHRVVDPESLWNRRDSSLWFRTVTDIASSEEDSGYFVYYCNDLATGPPSDENQVFTFADFFDRSDSTSVGNGWDVFESGADASIAGGALVFSSTDQTNRPVADHSFEAMPGRGSWRFGFNWSLTGLDTNYRVHMQLGDSSSMDIPPSESHSWPTVGIGPSLVWCGPSHGMSTHEGFGYEVAGSVSQVQMTTSRIAIEAIVDVASQTYDLAIDGTILESAVGFTSTQTDLDTIRFLSSDLNTLNFDASNFDYVIVRKTVVPEPAVLVIVFRDGFEAGSTDGWSQTVS